MTEPSQSLVGRLERKSFERLEEHGTGYTFVPCDAEDYGAEPYLVNPDGPEAAARITYLETRLEVVSGMGESADGISSRDATIALQDKRIAELEGEGWRSIETAPKDGTWVDLWKIAPDGVHGKRIAEVKWDNNRSFNGGVGRVAQPDAWVYRHGSEVWLDGGHFSHWMPLPSPPAASGSGG